jgi:hypothetical protein
MRPTLRTPLRLALASLLVLAGGARAVGVDDLVPIPGGGHVFGPGPRRLGLAGLHVEPSTISNFRGVTALAYVNGRATDAAGRRYRMANDLRVFQGDYVAADGSTRRGTFAFI